MSDEIITLVEAEIAESMSDLKRILKEFKQGWPKGWRVCKMDIVPVWDSYLIKYTVEKIPEDE